MKLIMNISRAQNKSKNISKIHIIIWREEYGGARYKAWLCLDLGACRMGILRRSEDVSDKRL